MEVLRAAAAYMRVGGARRTDAVDSSVQNATRGLRVTVLDVCGVRPHARKYLLQLVVRLTQHRQEARYAPHIDVGVDVRESATHVGHTVHVDGVASGVCGGHGDLRKMKRPLGKK